MRALSFDSDFTTFLQMIYFIFMLQETEEKLKKEEEAKNAVEQAKKKAEAEIKNVRQEVQDLETVLEKSEQAGENISL